MAARCRPLSCLSSLVVVVVVVVCVCVCGGGGGVTFYIWHMA